VFESGCCSGGIVPGVKFVMKYGMVLWKFAQQGMISSTNRENGLQNETHCIGVWRTSDGSLALSHINQDCLAWVLHIP
jgi:hypothetical protein